MTTSPPLTAASTTPGPPPPAPLSGRRAVTSHPALAVAAAVLALTLLGALASALVPQLGPTARPHPTLHGTLSEALRIFTLNGRLLIVPLLLVATRWSTGRLSRRAGDLIVGALLVVNPVSVGLALGRYPVSLLRYLPHLPIEYAALTVAVTAWVTSRLRGPGRPGHLLSSASLTVTLAAIAALTETFAVPHVH